MNEPTSRTGTIQVKGGGPQPDNRRPIRWWPLWVIAMGVASYGGWVWWTGEAQRQDRVFRTAIAILTGLFLVILWWLLLSRARWQVRIGGLVIAVATAVGVGSMFRFRTVTGDLVPVFEWRWKAAREFAPPSAPVRDTNVLGESSELYLGDFPQFLGPGRQVRLTGIPLARDWHSYPPQQVWRRPVGAGWAGFAVADRKAVTLEQEGGNEVMACYQLLTSEPLWRHAYAARYDSPVGGPGPRTVPAIAGGRVVALGATGVLTCVGLDDGKLHWSVNVAGDNGAIVPEWGFAGSPLVRDGRVIVSAGGDNGRSLVAYDLATGERVWSAGAAKAGYSAPTAGTLGGLEQLLIFNQDGVAGHDAATGALLWNYPWGKGQPHVALPVVVGSNTVFVSSGYGVGAELLEIGNEGDTWAAERVWKSIRMKAKFANVARRGDFIYGLDDGALACLDLSDGSQRWKEGRYGHGQLIMVDDLLLVTAENGDVVLLEPTPEGPNEMARINAFDHKQWNPPALAGQLLLVRTDREAACYRLPLLGDVPGP